MRARDADGGGALFGFGPDADESRAAVTPIRRRYGR